MCYREKGNTWIFALFDADYGWFSGLVVHNMSTLTTVDPPTPVILARNLNAPANEKQICIYYDKVTAAGYRICFADPLNRFNLHGNYFWLSKF